MTARAGEVEARAGERRGAAFWIGLIVGISVMAFGVVGAISNRDATRPLESAKWLVGADLLHDLIVAPTVCLVGWLLVRFAPRLWHAPLRAALVATASALVVGWVPLRGYGRAADNPSLAPLDYATAVVTVVVIIWIVCIAWGVAATVRDHTRRRPANVSGSEA